MAPALAIAKKYTFAGKLTPPQVATKELFEHEKSLRKGDPFCR